MNKKIFLTGAIMAATVIAVPAFAQTNEVIARPVPTAKVSFECVQAAVDVRETSIGVAFSAFSTAENTALSARKTALHDAWGTTVAKDRRAARNKAWSDYRTASRAAFTAMRTARKETWAAFSAASKACKVDVVEEPGQEGAGSLGL